MSLYGVDLRTRTPLETAERIAVTWENVCFDIRSKQLLDDPRKRQAFINGMRMPTSNAEGGDARSLQAGVAGGRA